MRLLTIIFLLGLVSCSSKRPEQQPLEKLTEIENSKPQSEDCSSYDLVEFLNTYKDYGTDGVFDTMFHRIQFHFANIKRNENDNCTYTVSGFDRLKGLVTPFNGEIKIERIVKNQGNLYQPETPSDDRLIEFNGTFILREDKEIKGSGIFKGTVYFMLTLNKENKLVDNMGEYMGDGFSNFIYEGTWTSYTTGKIKKCIWGQGRLPNTADFDIGAGELVVNEKYLKNGWEQNDKWESEEWWLKK